MFCRGGFTGSSSALQEVFSFLETYDTVYLWLYSLLYSNLVPILWSLPLLLTVLLVLLTWVLLRPFRISGCCRDSAGQTWEVMIVQLAWTSCLNAMIRQNPEYLTMLFPRILDYDLLPYTANSRPYAQPFIILLSLIRIHPVKRGLCPRDCHDYPRFCDGPGP